MAIENREMEKHSEFIFTIILLHHVICCRIVAVTTNECWICQETVCPALVAVNIKTSTNVLYDCRLGK